MANIFRRQPQISGDTNTWGIYLNAIINDATGIYSSYLYNDSGTLKLSKGLIGIDNDTNIGLATIDTITTITLTGTAGIWQKIELSVSGASVTLAATDIAGETDPNVVPSGFTGAYDPEKGGYYITSSKRCIGIVFVDGGGILGEIINAGIDYLTTLTTRNLVAKEITTENITTDKISGTLTDDINLTNGAGFNGAKLLSGSVHAAGPSQGFVFSAIAPFIPNVNDAIMISGTIATIAFSKAVRTASNVVSLYGIVSSSINTTTITEGSGSSLGATSLAW